VTWDQAFPSRTVRVIDPFGAGGGVDVIARALAERLAEMWGQRVSVENHPGAGSTAAPALVAKAPADGYTLLINTSAHAYSAVLGSHLSYRPLRDFVPVAALTSQPYVLVAGARSGITTVTELIAAAEARPGEIRFASAGTGTGTHIAVEKLNRDLRIIALHTPPGATDAITDVIEGTVTGLTAYAMLPIPTAAPVFRTVAWSRLASAPRAAHGCCRTFRRSRRQALSASTSRSGTESGHRSEPRPRSSASWPAMYRTPSPRQHCWSRSSGTTRTPCP